MKNRPMDKAFSRLSTPLIADACLRMKARFRVAPASIRPLAPGFHIAGHVLPVRHYGSVDIFLEAMTDAKRGDVLVIDNGGRMDEACIGDLTVLEAKATGLAGIIVRGCHRDSDELAEIGFPVFSLGAVPAGPQRLDARGKDALASADFGAFTVNRDDVVFADDDGVLFTRAKEARELLDVAKVISKTERKQAAAIRAGKKMRDQLAFDLYLKKSAADPSYTFRKHLRSVGGAIEE